MQYWKDKFSYCGTLRNQRVFNINDSVFANIRGNEIIKCRVIGVELTISDNPDYIYKLEIPEEAVVDFNHNIVDSVMCDRIFNTIEEARESAIDNNKRMSSLQHRQINNYFSQFGLEPIANKVHLVIRPSDKLILGCFTSMECAEKYCTGIPNSNVENSRMIIQEVEIN